MLTDLVTQDGEQFFLVQDVKIKFGKIRRIQTFFKDLFKSNKSIGIEIIHLFYSGALGTLNLSVLTF